MDNDDGCQFMNTAVCALPLADRPVAIEDLSALFATAVCRFGSDVRLNLAAEDCRIEEVRDLVACESACWSFCTVDIEGTDQVFTLHSSAHPTRNEIRNAIAKRARKESV